jgi:hypothetical protein
MKRHIGGDTRLNQLEDLPGRPLRVHDHEAAPRAFLFRHSQVGDLRTRPSVWPASIDKLDSLEVLKKPVTGWHDFRLGRESRRALPRLNTVKKRLCCGTEDNGAVRGVRKKIDGVVEEVDALHGQSLDLVEDDDGVRELV